MLTEAEALQVAKTLTNDGQDDTRLAMLSVLAKGEIREGLAGYAETRRPAQIRGETLPPKLLGDDHAFHPGYQIGVKHKGPLEIFVPIYRENHTAGDKEEMLPAAQNRLDGLGLKNLSVAEQQFTGPYHFGHAYNGGGYYTGIVIPLADNPGVGDIIAHHYMQKQIHHTMDLLDIKGPDAAKLVASAASGALENAGVGMNAQQEAFAAATKAKARG